MAKFKRFLLLLLVLPATSAVASSVILFDNPTTSSIPSVATQPALQPAFKPYKPVEPAPSSATPILDLDADMVKALEQQPNESETQFYERTKKFYEKSAKQMEGAVQNHFRAMEQLKVPDY